MRLSNLLWAVVLTSVTAAGYVQTGQFTGWSVASAALAGAHLAQGFYSPMIDRYREMLAACHARQWDILVGRVRVLKDEEPPPAA
jgi:hypothetical protein